jgi:hypothetical protein
MSSTTASSRQKLEELQRSGEVTEVIIPSEPDSRGYFVYSWKTKNGFFGCGHTKVRDEAYGNILGAVIYQRYN